MRYPRDFHGYGQTPPHANWPGGANIAVQFVLNYEEGGENNVLHGDAASEAFLADVSGGGTSKSYLPMIDMAETYGLPFGLRLKKGTTDKIFFRINDNLTGLDKFNAIAYGLRILN